ncbi:MAG TPA: SUMF1/EgtB/PvdO family nonheme iron enzyme [Terriglobales bacterium]|jgi:gamma-glutamyl hercynylcysteine S-oxide synthase|nr:SUMF1/EgtB/PvdO family nonheme iron enzyme [Terriglobales bacterium]
MLTAQKSVAVPNELFLELIERVSDARRQSDALFSLVRVGSLYERPIPERHRIIFYVGHLEAFDWNLLNNAVFGSKSAHPEFDRLFAFGIDPVGGGLPADLPSDWPSVEAVRDYVSSVRSVLDKNLAKIKISCEPTPARDGSPLRALLNVAVEHRLMHAETLAYMLHQLPLDMKMATLDPPILAGPPVAHRVVAIPAGSVTLGLGRNSETFGWDNEYQAHTVEVPAFEIDRYKVTNRQYLQFMAAGGYDTRTFWNDDDWNWKTARGISHPLFWKKDGNRWLWRAMFNERPLALDWPVYVSHAEASAYARWAAKSLPTEAEWQRAAYGTVDGSMRAYPWGNEAPDFKFGNFDFHRWNPMPVNAFPKGQSAFGVDDMLGNGWEWTSTVFGPFPGFEPFPFYRGYSADFFDGKHSVMKGGSARTAACMLRPTFRNWFQAHYQYVYAGFRCVSR